MKKINKNDLVVYLFFFIISFCKGIGLNNSNIVYLIVYAFVIVIAAFKLFKIGFSQKEFFILLSINIIGLLDFIIGKETTLLFTGITLLFLKQIDLKKIIKVLLVGRLMGFILMIILPSLGIIDMNILKFYRNGEFVFRYAFGYAHPNFAHSTFNIIVIMWVYLYYEKIKFDKIVFIEILNFILYKFTLSRTGFIILAVFLIITYIAKRFNCIEKRIPYYLNIILWGSIILGVFLAFGYGKISWINSLDKIFTGRIRYLSLLVTSYKIPIIKTQTYKGILFDNGYFDLFYNGGILATIWFLKFQMETNDFIKKNKMYKEALITIFLFIYSITESYYVSPIINIGILFFSYVIYKKNYEKIEESN